MRLSADILTSVPGGRAAAVGSRRDQVNASSRTGSPDLRQATVGQRLRPPIRRKRTQGVFQVISPMNINNETLDQHVLVRLTGPAVAGLAGRTAAA